MVRVTNCNNCREIVGTNDEHGITSIPIYTLSNTGYKFIDHTATMHKVCPSETDLNLARSGRFVPCCKCDELHDRENFQ